MNASLLDVAIVLVALYVALAVATSWVQEQIASLTHLRGNQLYRGVVSLLASSKPLADAIYAHPLVTAAVDKDSEKDSRPSYLDARNFSLALWQSVHSTVGDNAGDAAANAIAAPQDLLNALEARVSSLSDGVALKKPLAALLNAAGGDYEKLLTVTDTWFEAQMDRVSGWYKRTAQWWAVGIGALIVIVGGFDSISIAKQAYISPVVTQALAGSISQSVRDDTKPASAEGGASAPGDQSVAVANAFSNALAQEPTFKVLWSRSMLPKTYNDWLAKILGLLITILAVSLGAPFWFDLLKCLVNVRMAGDKPDNVSKRTTSA
ncbi:MAG: hypothetical protein WAJ85_04745 [Candidatus Baltobacteraceae bacterium]